MATDEAWRLHGCNTPARFIRWLPFHKEYIEHSRSDAGVVLKKGETGRDMAPVNYGRLAVSGPMIAAS